MVDDMRPFNKGEYVVNKGGASRGSISTQRTRTVETPDGKFINVNSLWKTHNGKTTTDIGHRSDDYIAATARRYEERTRKFYPKYDTVDQAVSVAKDRSKHGGASGDIPLTYIPRHGR